MLMMGDFYFIMIASTIRDSFVSEKFCSMKKMLKEISSTIDNAWLLAKIILMFVGSTGTFYVVSFHP